MSTRQLCQLRAVGLGLLVAVVAVACDPGYSVLFVNHSDATFVVELRMKSAPYPSQISPSGETIARVLIPAHAEGIVVQQFGIASATVTLYTSDCHSLARYEFPDPPNVVIEVDEQGVPHERRPGDVFNGNHPSPTLVFALTDACAGSLPSASP